MTDQTKETPDSTDELGDELSAEDQAYFDNAGAEPEPSEGVEAGPDAPKAEDQGEGQQEEPKPQKTVPHGAFHEERERRKEAEARAARVEDRMNQLLERAIPPKQAEPQASKMPDPDSDPVAAVKWLLEERQKEDRVRTEYQQRQEAANRQNSEAQRVYNEASQELRRDVAERPELAEAYTHVRENRIKELTALGHTPQQAAALTGQEEFQYISQARQNGMSVAQLVETLASARGWKPKADTTQIDAINKAQSASKTLSGNPGNPGGKLSASDIDAMDDDTFAAWLEANPKSAAAYLGG